MQVERISVDLPAEMARKLHEQVRAGGHASSDAVIRQAIADWQAREDRLADMRARIAEADADPRPSLTDDEVALHFARRAR